MRDCVSPHEFVAGKIHDVVHVIDGIICLAAWPLPSRELPFPLLRLGHHLSCCFSVNQRVSQHKEFRFGYDRLLYHHKAAEYIIE